MSERESLDCSDSEDLELLLAEITELEHENDGLESKAMGLNKQIKSLSTRASKMTVVSEEEEEHIANGLFRRMDGLREENSRLTNIMEVEEQEAKDIVLRIAQVRQRRVELENKMEVEQESQMNKLHKSLVDLANDKSVLEKKLHNERAAYLTELHRRISALGANSSSTAGASPALGEGGSVLPLMEGEVGTEHDQSIVDLKEEIDKLLMAEQIQVSGTSTATSAGGGNIINLGNQSATVEASQWANDPTTPLAEVPSQYEQLATTLRQLQIDRIIVKNKSERVREQLEKAQADLIFETELQTRLSKEGETSACDETSQSTSGYHSMDQESLRTQSSDSGNGGVRLGKEALSDLRAHTHRVLNSATPTPIHDPRRGTPPRTPPESTRSHSSAGHRSELSSVRK